MIIYNTVDLEITNHRLSYSENLDTNLLLPYLKLAEKFCEYEIKSTFFLSIAPKSTNIAWQDYDRCLDLICRINQANFSEYINIQPHMHCLNLPLLFTDKSDHFSDYTPDQQQQILEFGKNYLEDKGICVNSFRPGGFKQNSHYYDVLEASGYSYSSTLQVAAEPNINLVTGQINNRFISRHGSVSEFPVTSVYLKSVKGGFDLINLSPDFFEYDAISHEVEQLDNIVLNFHSFSLYHSRPVREKFSGRKVETIRHLLREFILKKIAFSLRSEIMTRTIYNASLIDWLDAYVGQSEYKWIGET